MNTIQLIKNYNYKLNVEGILSTMVDKRNSLALWLKKCKEHFGEIVYSTTIPRNIKISEALATASQP